MRPSLFSMSQVVLVALALLPGSHASTNTSTSTSSAADIAALPTCALQCLVSALPYSACAATNQTCICADDALQSAVQTCALQNCTVKEALFAKNLTSQICNEPIRDRSQDFATAFIVVVSAASVSVFLRMLFKFLSSTLTMGWDDWTILITHANGIAMAVLGVYGLCGHGLGRDLWTLPFEDLTPLLQYLYFSEVFYFLNITLLKASLLFFYMRIFNTPGTTKLLWASHAFNALFGLTCSFVAIFQCSPLNYVWYQWDGEHEGTCLNVNGLVWTNAIVGITLDFWVLAIPLNKLRSLNLGWKKKVAVGLMFCAGTLVTVVSILRLTALKMFVDSENFSWDSGENILLSGLELGLGTMCACMPTGFAALIKFLSVFKVAERSHNDFERPNRQGSDSLEHQRANTTDDIYMIQSRRWASLESAPSEGGEEVSLAETRKEGSQKEEAWLGP